MGEEKEKELAQATNRELERKLKDLKSVML